MVIGSAGQMATTTRRTIWEYRKTLEQLMIGSDADILICTKSDLVVRDIDLLKKLGRVIVSWSINTLDEKFRNDMDSASSIEHRIAAMKQAVYGRQVSVQSVSLSPVFPSITILKQSLSG